jgi:hypothetical protein
MNTRFLTVTATVTKPLPQNRHKKRGHQQLQLPVSDAKPNQGMLIWAMRSHFITSSLVLQGKGCLWEKETLITMDV